jgi:hypothetical protein
MATIKLSSDEKLIYKDFKEGNSVQVRITVPPSEEGSYVKGKTVQVAHGNFKAMAKIVSEPLVIGSPLQGQDKTISLIIERIA